MILCFFKNKLRRDGFCEEYWVVLLCSANPLPGPELLPSSGCRPAIQSSPAPNMEGYLCSRAGISLSRHISLSLLTSHSQSWPPGIDITSQPGSDTNRNHLFVLFWSKIKPCWRVMSMPRHLITISLPQYHSLSHLTVAHCTLQEVFMV